MIVNRRARGDGSSGQAISREAQHPPTKKGTRAVYPRDSLARFLFGLCLFCRCERVLGGCTGTDNP